MAIVQRQPADKAGDEVVSPVLLTAGAQIERGRQEINYNSTDRVIKTCLLTRFSFCQPGEIVAIQGKDGVIPGMLTDIAIEVENEVSVKTTISVESVK